MAAGAEVEAVGVDAHGLPDAPGVEFASQPRQRFVAQRLRPRQQFWLGFDQRLNAFERRQQVLRRQHVGAAKAAVEMHALDAHAPHGEVAEADVELGLGIAANIALARGRIVVANDRAADGEAGLVERVASPADAGDEQRSAGVVGEVPGVAGEFRHQEQRRAVPIAGDADESRQRQPARGVEGRERSGARQT